MHPALLVFLVALINQVITWIGKDLIKDFVYKGYVTVFSRGASKRQASIKKELFETKQEMNLTSAQDEFAKWARLRRKVDKLTQDLDVQNKALAGTQFSFSMVFKGFMFILNSVVPFVLTSYFGSTPMFFLPPGEWFGPLGYLFSFPKAPLGAVSSTVWATVCGRVLQLVGAYCYEIFVAGKAPAVQQRKAVPVAVEKESVAGKPASEHAGKLKHRKAGAAAASS